MKKNYRVYCKGCSSGYDQLVHPSRMHPSVCGVCGSREVSLFREPSGDPDDDAFEDYENEFVLDEMDVDED